MCISIPAKVIAVHGQTAEIETQGVRRNVLLAIESVQPGSWVLTYGGVAVAALAENEAEETLKLLSIIDIGK